MTIINVIDQGHLYTTDWSLGFLYTLVMLMQHFMVLGITLWMESWILRRTQAEENHHSASSLDTTHAPPLVHIC